MTRWSAAADRRVHSRLQPAGARRQLHRRKRPDVLSRCSAAPARRPGRAVVSGHQHRGAHGRSFMQHRLAPTVRLTATALLAERQTFLPGVQWQPVPDLTTAFVAGVGTNRPYAASSVILRQGPLGVKASYAWNPRPLPAGPGPHAEPDRGRARERYASPTTWARSSPWASGRQNYVQDSADSKPPVRATGNTVFAGGVWRELTADGRDLRFPVGGHQQSELLFRGGPGADPLARCRAVPAPEPARGTAGRRPPRWSICGGGSLLEVGLSQQISLGGWPTHACSSARA